MTRMLKKIYSLFAAIGILLLGTACASSATTFAQTPTQTATRPLSTTCNIPGKPRATQQWANGGPLSLTTTLAMSTQNLPAGPHIQLTRAQTRTADDIQRSNMLLQDIRTNLAQYLDYCKAVQAGYLPVAPEAKQEVYHFASTHITASSSQSLDTAHPAALLYVKIDGIYQLIGAMYMVPANVTEEQLNTLFPGSIIPWFKQVNYCLPHGGQQPVNASSSSITTATACAKVGGKFTPQAYGWTLQVFAFGE